MRSVIVIGGGAAGMMAAGTAARAGAQVLLLEKNRLLGKKLLITGKGRCNLTNACEIEEVIARFGAQGKFLYSSLHRFPPMATQSFFVERGLELVVERGQRVFPASGRSSDVVKALADYVRESGAAVRLNSPVMEILTDRGANGEGMANKPLERRITGVKLSDHTIIEADRVILATGGASYPGTGSTGDGYVMAGRLGHTIDPLLPALVPLRVKEEWVKTASGLSLRNVQASLFHGEKLIGKEFGEMLITHFGVSGPIILTLSRLVPPLTNSGSTLRLEIDLKPALDDERLDARLQRDFQRYARKAIKNALSDLLPKALIPIVIAESMIEPECPVHQITKEERHRLLRVLKGLPLTVLGTLPLAAAIVTAGGVMLDEVDPRTMASRLVDGLFFGGEVLDLAANTGGFNLQAAFATGHVAGLNAAS
ncbi:MAG: NAD(P)/FAD-dependent oxidoreductase [Firmicutes bacterium]|nr:NAD(P)/FAD-dependent oxidoreductase [Bacillota bacterium]